MKDLFQLDQFEFEKLETLLSNSIAVEATILEADNNHACKSCQDVCGDKCSSNCSGDCQGKNYEN